MAKIFGQLESAQAENLAANPASSSTGRVFFDTVLNVLKVYAGAAWRSLVDTDSSQTLTNKTLSAGSNTISGLLHGTQVDNPSSGVHGVTGSLVGTSDAQVITNKDIDGGTASNTLRITVPKNTKTNLDGLTRKEATVVYGSDTKKLYVDDGSSLKAVGSSAAGSGETNYVTNPSGVEDNAAATPAGWATSDAAKITVTTTKTAAELPRENITKSGIKILSVASAVSTSAGAYWNFTLDDVDSAGRIMKIKWDQKLVGAYTAGHLEVVITDQNATFSSRVVLATPFTTAIPASDGTFQTYFLAPSSQACSLVIRATADMADNVGLVISDVVVGPNVQVQGSAITDWVSSTWTSSYDGANVATTSKQRVVGDSLQVQTATTITTASGMASTTYVLTPPSGVVIDTSKFNASGNLIGNAWYLDSSATPGILPAGIVRATSSTAVRVYIIDSPNTAIHEGYAAGTDTNHPVAEGDGDVIIANFTIPVVGLSSNVTLANRALEVYIADDGVGDVFGPNGALVPNQAIGTQVQRTFTLPANTQQSDFTVLEYRSTSGNWQLAADILPFVQQGAKNYGVRGYWSSATDYTVTFGAGGLIADNATYANNGSNPWSTAYTAGDRFRLRRVSGGASVGYPVSSANIVGRTDGVAPASGMVGEKVAFTSRSISAVTTGITGDATPIVTLGPGSWELFPAVDCSTPASITGIKAYLATNSTSDASGLVSAYTGVASSAVNVSATLVPIVLDLAASTSYYAKAGTVGANATVVLSGFAIRKA